MVRYYDVNVAGYSQDGRRKGEKRKVKCWIGGLLIGSVQYLVVGLHFVCLVIPPHEYHYPHHYPRRCPCCCLRIDQG